MPTPEIPIPTPPPIPAIPGMPPIPMPPAAPKSSVNLTIADVIDHLKETGQLYEANGEWTLKVTITTVINSPSQLTLTTAWEKIITYYSSLSNVIEQMNKELSSPIKHIVLDCSDTTEIESYIKEPLATNGDIETITLNCGDSSTHHVIDRDALKDWAKNCNNLKSIEVNLPKGSTLELKANTELNTIRI